MRRGRRPISTERGTRSWPRALLLILVALLPGPASAQHEGHDQPPPRPKPKPEKPAPEPARERRLFQSDMTLMTGMAPEDPLGDMPARGWQWMNMGVVRLGYNHQSGDSGDEAVESTNWAMVMAYRPAGAGRITLMLMSSLEPATIPERGSPQLFQTGEAFEGKPLVDRQHPHDLFMNLSATYRAPLSSHSAIWFQIAPAGEPALGPTAFMHRASAGENPTAPLGHHWQDSSHITRNVITGGGGWRRITLEASGFHGEEPDEERWDLDGGDLDSGSGRAKLTLPRGWSGQLSHGYLHQPEALEPGDTHRTTASIHYGAAGDRPNAASLVWGRNNEDHGVSDSFLAEYAHQVTVTDHLYGRFEWVEKDADLLETKDLPEEEMGEATDQQHIAEIAALTLGYFRSFGRFTLLRALTTGIGGDLTFYSVPSSLEPVYGDSPISFHTFLRLRWGMPHGGDKDHQAPGHGAHHSMGAGRD